MKAKYLSLLLILLYVQSAVAQQQTFLFNYRNQPAVRVLNDWEKRFNLRFSYKDELLAGKRFSCPKKEYTFQEISALFEQQLQVKLLQVAEQYYIILPEKKFNWLKQALKEVVVNAYLTEGISKYKDGSFRLSLRNLGILPGLTEPDVLESLQQLPGVISTDETATNFSVRGGKTDQNTVYWDDIPIYQTGHFFGMISPFNTYMIDKVKYYYQGTPARFEGGASGNIDLLISGKIQDSTHFEWGVNGLATDALLKLPLIKNKLSLSLSARTSYRNLWKSPTLDAYENKVLYHTNVVDNDTRLDEFSFNDFGLKLNYHPRKDTRLSASLIHIQSNLELENQYVNLPGYVYDDRLQAHTDGFNIKAMKKLNKKWSLSSKISVSQYDMLFKDRSYRDNRQTGFIHKENFVSHSLFDTGFTYRLKGNSRLEAGYQYAEKRSAYLFKLVVNDEVYVFDYFRTVLNTHSLYAQWKYRNSKLLNIYAGGRAQYEQETGNFYFEPRFVLSKTILPYLDWQITGEIKHQNIQQYTKTVIGLLNLENKIWHVADDVNYPVVKARQFSTGMIYNHHKWIVELDFYAKLLDNITLTVPYRIYDKYEFVTGKEYVQGADFFVNKDFKPFKLWFSYGLMSANYRFKALKNNQLFPSDQEVKNRIATAFTYYTGSFKATLGWYWHSPQVYYKDIVNANEDENTDVENFKPDFTIERLSSYNRIDFSSIYDFKMGKKKNYKLRAGFSVRNIFNNKNHLSTEKNSYSLDTSLQDFDRYGLSRTYNFALRFYWN